MERSSKMTFRLRNFAERLSTMLAVDMRRMAKSRMFWILLGCALVMPILALTMMTGFGGTEIADPTTGAVQTMESFTNAWQIIGTESNGSMATDMTAMMNINLMFFLTGVFVCLFVSEDFRSGYAKNLFTVRAQKGDYIMSKTLIGFLAGALFLIAFFVGAMLGGSFAGLSFELGAVTVVNVILCMLAKIFLMAVFVSIFLLMSVIGKNRAWLSILLSLFAGMLLFMMIPMMTPLNASIMHVGMCLAGGAIFAAAIGLFSKLILNKTNLI